MAISFLFTVGAAMAFIPAGVVLFLVLDQYAEPRVPKSLFDERKVFLTFAVGIPVGIILGLIFLAYAQALSTASAGAIGAASVYFLLFLLVAALARRVLVHTKTFGGSGGKDPLVPVHTFSFGAVAGATIGLALSLEQFSVFYPKGSPPSAEVLLLLAGYSLGFILLEAWAGLRFGRAMRKGFSWLPPFSVLVGEALGLLAMSPLFAGLPAEGAVGLGLMILVGAWALAREERAALRPLRRTSGIEKERSTAKFSRGSVVEEGAEGPSSDETPSEAREPQPSGPSDPAQTTEPSAAGGPDQEATTEAPSR